MGFCVFKGAILQGLRVKQTLLDFKLKLGLQQAAAQGKLTFASTLLSASPHLCGTKESCVSFWRDFSSLPRRVVLSPYAAAALPPAFCPCSPAARSFF